MRNIKTPEERKNEILDTANRLFNEKGYDNTSVADIINEVGIAKGTLYYYFKSKEDIMDGIIEKTSEKLLAASRQIADDDSLPVFEKMEKAIAALNLKEDQGKEIMQHIHKPQNALMHQKQLSTMINGVTPILTKIINQGITEGIFKLRYPYETVEMIVIYVQNAFDDPMTGSLEDRQKRIIAFIYNVERLLGTPEGGLGFITKLFN